LEIYAGIDIVEIERFKSILKRHGTRFLNRIYTDREIEAVPEGEEELYFCFSFSFKESVWKALPDFLQKHVYFKDIEVLWNGKNPSILVNTGKKLKMFNSFFEIAGNAVTLTLVFLD